MVCHDRHRLHVRAFPFACPANLCCSLPVTARHQQQQGTFAHLLVILQLLVPPPLLERSPALAGTALPGPKWTRIPGSRARVAHSTLLAREKRRCASARAEKCHSWHFMAAAATLFDFWITSETEFSAQSRLLADGSSVGATQRKLPTDRPSWCNGSCSRQVQPTALTLHAGSCPSASSRRALAAWREARRRCRGHRDHHLDQALVRDASSPGHS